MLKRAIALHQRGEIAKAVSLYRKILAENPKNADALHLLGVIEAQRGNSRAAIVLIDRAIEFSPNNAGFLSNRGLALQELSRFEEALASYDRALTIRPDHPEVLNNRGLALQELGHFDEALKSYARALAIKPAYPDALYNQGRTLQQLKRLDEALASYDRALSIKPDHAKALNNRGFALHELKRFGEALSSYARCLALQPGYAEAHNNRGLTLQRLKRLDEALSSYDRALALKPDYADALNNRGYILQEFQRFGDALASHERALVVKPDFAEALNNRGLALQQLRRFDDALVSYDRALGLKPDYVQALNNRGSVLHDLNRLDESLDSYARALTCDPTYPEALNNRGLALLELRRFNGALASYDAALAIKPDYAEAHHNRGIARLLGGDLVGGWPDYEWRWKTANFASKPAVKAPEWKGEDLEKRSILIFAEQGRGDVIQFVRYLPLLIQRGASVSFFGPKEIMRLLGSMGAEINLATSSNANDAFDFQCALMSLPFRFGTEVQSIPAATRYLAAERNLVAKWKARIGERGFKIGIAWQGSPHAKVDQGRSIPLAEFVPLSHLPRVRLISLQKQYGLDQLAALPAQIKIETLGEDFDSGQDAFIDTAAVMGDLDLIVTSDTAIAHLSGAVGRPTWVALKHVPDWRWMLDRGDSPWYPSTRLFRQETAGDWRSVFATITQELQSLLQNYTR